LFPVIVFAQNNVNRICGFESSNLTSKDEIASSYNASVVSSGTYGRSGSYYGQLANDAGTQPYMELAAIATNSSNNGDYYEIGFYWVLNASPAVDIDIVKPATNDDFIMVAKSGEDSIDVIDANGSQVDTAIFFDMDDELRYNYVQVQWQKNNSGTIIVWINGQLVAEYSGDFESGSALVNYRFEGALSGTSNVVRIDDFYHQTGQTKYDILKQPRVVMTRSSLSNATDNGDALDFNVWSAVSEILTITYGSYNGVNQSGSTDADNGTWTGPLGNSRFYRYNIIACQVVIKAQRGNGGSTTHDVIFGNATDGTDSQTLSLTTAWVAYFVMYNSGKLPTRLEYGRLGFQLDAGGQDFDVDGLLGNYLIETLQRIH
jgi:hypothetical protein